TGTSARCMTRSTVSPPSQRSAGACRPSPNRISEIPCSRAASAITARGEPTYTLTSHFEAPAPISRSWASTAARTPPAPRRPGPLELQAHPRHLSGSLQVVQHHWLLDREHERGFPVAPRQREREVERTHRAVAPVGRHHDPSAHSLLLVAGCLTVIARPTAP